MTDTLLPSVTDLPQERRLVTELPGPRSRALMERRAAAVSAGVGGTMPVFAERAGGGVIVDVDGNKIGAEFRLNSTTAGASGDSFSAASRWSGCSG